MSMRTAAASVPPSADMIPALMAQCWMWLAAIHMTAKQAVAEDPH